MNSLKCILSSRQTKEYLNKADMISVDYRDRRQIPDLIDDYIVDIIVKIYYHETDIDWKYLSAMDKMLKSKSRKMIICLSDLENIKDCKKHDIDFYYGFPVSSFYQMRALVEAGVCAARLAPPLTHMLDQIKVEFDIDILAVPNVAYNDCFPREDGVCGGWIRPEDLLTTYADYIDMVEFEDCDNKKEQALYRIYFEDQAWPGDLGMIITNFNYMGVNRMIPPELAEKRVACGQKCQSYSPCRICYRYMDLANPSLFENIKK